jgi:hypothetical protein
MNQLPEEDENLIIFLRQNRPVSPPASSNFEQKLMNAIDDRQQQNKRNNYFIWSIASAILVAFGIYWFGVDRSYRVADNLDNTEIENVLFGSWQEVDESSYLPQDNNISEADWLLITGDNNNPTVNNNN